MLKVKENEYSRLPGFYSCFDLGILGYSLHGSITCLENGESRKIVCIALILSACLLVVWPRFGFHCSLVVDWCLDLVFEDSVGLISNLDWTLSHFYLALIDHIFELLFPAEC